MSETEKIRVYRGLKGVHFDRSPTTYIDGRKGELRYWGYSIHDLAEHSTFEETAYLLLHGELPTAGQLQSFDAQLKAGRQLPAPVAAHHRIRNGLEIVEAKPELGHAANFLYMLKGEVPSEDAAGDRVQALGRGRRAVRLRARARQEAAQDPQRRERHPHEPAAKRRLAEHRAP